MVFEEDILDKTDEISVINLSVLPSSKNKEKESKPDLLEL